MKKILLSSAAMLAALSYGTAAFAQSMTTTTLMGSQNSLQGAVNATTAPDPGTVLIRLGGHMNFYGAAMWDSGDHGTGANIGNKQTQTEFGDYLHLSPSVDGTAANGLRYGVYSDFWTEHSGVGTTANGVGGGSITSISNDVRYNSTLYLPHAWTYIGLPTVGTIRLGTDGPVTLFQTGTFENFNDGGWNGDIPDMLSGNAYPVWPFAAVGNAYASAKATYLSPQIYGFEVGVSYEPTTSANDIFDQCNTASTGCARLGSSNTAADLARRRNAINIGSRYRGTFGPIGIAAEAQWLGSGTIQADTGGLSGATLTSYNAASRYRGWDIGVLGLAVTYGGLTVGGHGQYGNFQGQWGLAPIGAPATAAWLVGASYTVGPVIVGASYFQVNEAGASYGYSGAPTPTQANTGQERDRGFAAGGTYTITPGLSLFLDYLWGDRKENGIDILNGGSTYNAATGKDSHLNNQTKAQLIGFGTQLRW